MSNDMNLARNRNLLVAEKSVRDSVSQPPLSRNASSASVTSASSSTSRSLSSYSLLLVSDTEETEICAWSKPAGNATSCQSNVVSKSSMVNVNGHVQSNNNNINNNRNSNSNSNSHQNLNYLTLNAGSELREITDVISSNDEFSDSDCLNLLSDDCISNQSTPQSTPSPPPSVNNSACDAFSSDNNLTAAGHAQQQAQHDQHRRHHQHHGHQHHHHHHHHHHLRHKHETAHSQHHRDRTLVIFDWDDTLHPTSAINESGSKLDIELVRKFCLFVYETLLTMIRLYGSSNIYIVSNADKLWIEKCLNQLSGGYFVNIYHLISLYDIQIISAKNEFSSKYPNDSTKWKQLAFEHLVQQHYLKYNQRLYLHHIENQHNHSYLHKKPKQFSVVSIGDSQHEYIASKRVIHRLNAEKIDEKKILLHRIKLLQNPSLKQLIEQYSLIKKIAPLFKSEFEEIDIDYQRESLRYRHNKRQKHHCA